MELVVGREMPMPRSREVECLEALPLSLDSPLMSFDLTAKLDLDDQFDDVARRLGRAAFKVIVEPSRLVLRERAGVARPEREADLDPGRDWTGDVDRVAENLAFGLIERSRVDDLRDGGSGWLS